MAIFEKLKLSFCVYRAMFTKVCLIAAFELKGRLKDETDDPAQCHCSQPPCTSQIYLHNSLTACILKFSVIADYISI